MRTLVVMLCAGALAACSRGAATDAGDRNPGIGLRYLHAQKDAGFAIADAPRVFAFPADHASHPRYRTEWWYFTGNVESESGAKYGFELTFFRVALGQPETAAERRSPWAAKQVWMAHFALTDVARMRFAASERMARDALGLAGAREDPIRVWVKGWSAERSGSGSEERWKLVAENESTGANLVLTSGEPPVLNGDGGRDQKGPEAGNASYYYSLPRLNVSGTLTVEGRPVPVTGDAWMDREWSTSALGEDIAGWDWFGLRLSDGGSVMFYRLRRRDGTADAFSGGTLVSSSGAQRHLGRDEVELTPLKYWTSPLGAARYPVGWRIRVPTAALDLDVRPYLENQELDLSVRYWEGAVRGEGSRGSGPPIAAEGYLELAGY